MVFIHAPDPDIFRLVCVKMRARRPDFFFTDKDGKVKPGYRPHGRSWRSPVSIQHLSKEVPSKASSVESVKAKAYITPSESMCPALHPNKAAQRSELVENLKGGTVLELFAGEGNLSKHVYADKADRIIAVDMDSRALKKAEEKLKDNIEVETYPSHNVDWIENKLPEMQLGDLKVVDFDAFGSPADSMKAFFENYKVTHPMRVGVTDGSSVYVSHAKS